MKPVRTRSLGNEGLQRTYEEISMLSTQRRLSQRTLAILLSVVMLNIYVLMGAPTSRASTSPSAGEATSNKLMVGRLALADQQSIFVNGNEARTGTTIFSGMRLQSPAGVNALVQLGSLGHVDLEPGSDLTLDFTSAYVSVKVAAGAATLTTNDGVNAMVTSPDGKVAMSEGTKAAVLSSAGSLPAAKMSNKAKALWIIIPIAVVVTIIIVVVATDDDDSPSN